MIKNNIFIVKGLENLENLPEPETLVKEIVEDLENALEEFRNIEN